MDSSNRNLIGLELLDELGLAPLITDHGIDLNPLDAKISKVLGRCPICGIWRLAYIDWASGDTLTAQCPPEGSPAAKRCFWGGRNRRAVSLEGE